MTRFRNSDLLKKILSRSKLILLQEANKSPKERDEQREGKGTLIRMELRERRESAKRSEAANNCTIIIPHKN